VGFSATSYRELNKLVKNYLDEQVGIGNITQGEADILLSEIPSE